MTGAYHVHPTNDKREHVIDGEPCPCMPRVKGDVITHNSYDAREVGNVCRNAFDLLGLALAQHSHTWTEDEREAFEHAIQLLDMHWPHTDVEVAP